MHLVPMDSPLRRILTTVERRDVLFLDGIRYVERVVLHAGPQKVDLANLNDAVERFVEWYTRCFSTTFTGDDRYGADMHIRFSIVPAGSPTTNGDDFKIID